MTNQEGLKLLHQHSALLMEHFDSVQLVATHRDGDSTFVLSNGKGNYFARYGSVVCWLKAEDKEDMACEEDDGD